MPEKSDWIEQAKKLNPSESTEYLGRVYDDHVVKPQTAVQEPSAAKPTQTASSKPYVSPMLKTPQQLISESGIISDSNLTGDDAKTSWITKAKKLNPSESTTYLSNVYDDHVKKSDISEPSANDKLQAIMHFNAKIKKSAPIENEEDNDTDKSGFDTSDKMSMLGALYNSGRIGVGDVAAGLTQLGITGAKKIGLKPSVSKRSFTDWYTRKVNRDKLYREAIVSHPIISSIGRIGGGILPFMAAPEAKVESIGENASKLGTEKLMQQISKRFEANIAKGAQRAATAGRFAAKGGIGAAIGATQFDPTADSQGKQAITGAILNMALPGGAALIKRIASGVPKEAAAISAKYGINFPTLPSIEKLASYIPFSGVGHEAQVRSEQIAKTGKDIAKGIIGKSGESNYGEILHGEFLKNYLSNKTMASKLYDKVGELADKEGGNVKLKNYREAIGDALDKQNELPEPYRNKRLIAELEQYKNTIDAPYTKINEIKKRIGNEVGKLTKGSAFGSYTKDEVGDMKSLYGSIKQDMNEYAESKGGEIKNLHDQADNIYKDKILPFESGPYKKLTDKDFDTDSFIGKFLQPNKEFKATELLKGLPVGSKKGINAARAAVLQHSLETAEIPGAGFNSEKFIKEALRLGKVNKLLFTKPQLDSLNGYQKLINFSKKIGTEQLDTSKVASSAGVGKHMFLKGIGSGAAFFHPFIATAVLLGSRGARKIINSKAGRNLLTKVADYNEKTPSSTVMKTLLKAMRLTGVTTGAQTAGAL